MPNNDMRNEPHRQRNDATGDAAGWGGLTFGQARTGAVAYIASTVGYTLYKSAEAGIPLERGVVITGLSFFVSFIVPIAAGVIGYETGRLGGALVGSVGAAGYRMTQPDTDKRTRRIDAFKKTAQTIGKAVGISAALVGGLWAVHSFMTEAVDTAAHHAPKKSRARADAGMPPNRQAPHAFYA